MGQNRAIFAAVALAEGDELQGVAAVGLVVPEDERGGPGTRVAKTFEELLGVGWEARGVAKPASEPGLSLLTEVG